VTNQPFLLRCLDECFVQALRKFRGGELGKRPRELRLMRISADSPTTEASQGHIDRQAIQ